MKILVLEKEKYDFVLDNCVKALKSPGAFVLIPTETVYGLVCLSDDTVAKTNIYKAKGRKEDKPFQILINGIEMARSYGCLIDKRVEKIVKAFCPGPITIVVPNVNGDKTGFRIPNEKFVLDLITLLNKPLCGTSANLSGEKPALDIKEGLAFLKTKPLLTIDGGALPEGRIASTVVEVTSTGIKILRKGPILVEEILNAI